MWHARCPLFTALSISHLSTLSDPTTPHSPSSTTALDVCLRVENWFSLFPDLNTCCLWGPRLPIAPIALSPGAPHRLSAAHPTFPFPTLPSIETRSHFRSPSPSLDDGLCPVELGNG